MSPTPAPDRYDPLPGVFGLPGHFLRRLSPRGRRYAGGVAAVLGVALLAGGVVAIPAIEDGKRARADRQSRDDARRRARLVTALRAESRPIAGHGTASRGLVGDDAVVARRELVAALATAVGADARRRADAGELNEAPGRVECSPYPAGTDDAISRLDRLSARYECLAVTGEIGRYEFTDGGITGYPYRALVRFDTGRFSFCKFSGRPAEGSISHSTVVTVPRVCGGNG
jgi:hypothetical protein